MAERFDSQSEPIPGYKLIERLGGGGFGEVWKAVAPGGLLKAIKFVYGDLHTTTDDGQRAEQELKALSRVKSVRHPYILSLERYDIINNRLIIVMELADRNLWDRFRECRSQGLPGIPREELLRYMDESAEALDLMNCEHQLQHLDIKPQNIFLVYNHIKVADFGLVKDLEGMAASVTGGVTPVYAAPETFDGWVSRFCDQYSLAIVYQELLTGQRPFAGTNVRQLIMQHLQGRPNLDPLPPGDRDAVGRALSKSPDSRFPSCKAFVEALRSGGAAATAGVETTPATSVTLPTPAYDAHTPAKAREDRGKVPEPEDSAVRPVVREILGEGPLMPSVVVGLGQVGMHVLQVLRDCLRQRVGPAEMLPQLRLINFDVDPDSQRLGLTSKIGAPLTNDELVALRLNRPHHYLRSRDVRAGIETWFYPKMIYRIPRNLVTTGLRGLGRLAFFDNYRQAIRKLQGELEACSRGDVLQRALEINKLDLRTNQPRVYVISSLAGGSGSGMFLDVAYCVRSLMNKLGFQQPSLVGVFFLPPLDRNLTNVLPMGNTFASLTELYHFSQPGSTFTARYDDKDGRVNDSGAPYNRSVLLNLPGIGEERPYREAVGKVVDFLYRDLLTPLGRSVDQARSQIEVPPDQPREPSVQTFAAFRLSWPRRQLLQRVARNLCKRLVQRWISKDSAPLRDSVQVWSAEQWTRYEFAAEGLIERFQKACEKALEEAPETAFNRITEPLLSLNVHAPEQCLPVFRQTLKELDDLTGRPEGTTGVRATRMKTALDTASHLVVKEWGKKMVDLAFRLIEQPEFRLAGAEEAIRQFVGTIEKVLQHYEPLVKELASRVQDGYERINALFNNPTEVLQSGRRAATLMANFVELFRLYPKWRYQSLILQQVNLTYVSLRGYLSDQLREINFCRTRLVELQRGFESTTSSGAADFGAVRNFYPANCRNLEDAVNQVLELVTAPELQDLDSRIQKVVKEQFTALSYICMTSANLVKNLEIAMQQEAERFTGERMGTANVAEMFLTHTQNEEEAVQVLVDAYNRAAPSLPGLVPRSENELCIMAVPPGEAGERVLALARRALAGIPLLAASSPDDILIYREVASVRLKELEHLGPFGCEAYEQMSTGDACSPHSRMDIQEWQGPAASVTPSGR